LSQQAALVARDTVPAVGQATVLTTSAKAGG
jgi:hypothetical protein